MRRTMALVLVALAVTAGCGKDKKDDAASTTTTAPPSTTVTTVPTTTTTTTEARSHVVDAAGTAQAWIQAIADGDDDRAIALTSPRSLTAFGGAEGFKRDEIALAEGWGAWGHAEQKTVTVVDLPGLDGVVLVVLHGEVSQEGPPEESWAAMPVVATADGDRVEPFLDLGTVEVDPPAGAEIEESPRFTAFVLGGRDVRFVVDAGQAGEPALAGADGDQQRAELDTAGLEPGLHVLTVVLSNGDGVMARTFLYRVAG